MERHIRDKHVGGSNRCKECRQCFLSAFNLERHTTIRHNKERYCCNTCGKTFKALKEYTEHQYDHLGYRPFNCPQMSADGVLCDFSSKRKDACVRLFSNICECFTISFPLVFRFIFHLHKQHDIQYKEAIHGMKENVYLAREMFAEKTNNRLREFSHKCDQCDKSFQTNTGLYHHK
jgi:transposase-like protein